MNRGEKDRVQCRSFALKEKEERREKEREREGNREKEGEKGPKEKGKEDQAGQGEGFVKRRGPLSQIYTL